MNKTTTTMLMAAGLVFLAGCKTEVMRDRHYPGEPPQNDPEMRQGTQTPRPMEGESTVAPAPAPEKEGTAPRSFRPMEGSYSGDGIEEPAPRRRAARRGQADKSSPRAAGSVYIVKPGDTLGRIARKHNVSVKALRDANNRTPAQDRFLRPGTKLVIPGAKGAAAPAARKGKAAPAPRKNAGKLNADGTYTMVKGDNIPKVARMFGIRPKALQRANNLTDEETTRLQIGHKLTIPTGDDAKISSRKSARKSARKAPAAPQKQTQKPADVPPPPPAPVDNAGTNNPLPPPPAPVPAAEETTGVLPPPAPVAGTDNTGTDFVSVAGSSTLEEFAAKNNTTVAEVLRLNPQIDRNAPISNHGMLYVPRAAK